MAASATLEHVDRPSRTPLYLGVLLAACGWAAIGLGWYQAGQHDLETGQLPFVISGGFGGWGLLLMGAVGVLMDTIRQASWRAQVRHEALLSALAAIPELDGTDEEDRGDRESRRKRKPAARRRRSTRRKS